MVLQLIIMEDEGTLRIVEICRLSIDIVQHQSVCVCVVCVHVHACICM